MREYTFDVKFFAAVRVQAISRDAAETVLRTAVGQEPIIVNLPGSHPTARIIDAKAYLDDEGFPYLCEVDGILVDNDEAEADAEIAEFRGFPESG